MEETVMSSSLLRVFFVLCLGLLAGASAIGQMAEPKARPVLVGVVDTGVLFRG